MSIEEKKLINQPVKADFKTKLSGFLGFVTGFVSNTYWVADIVDSMIGDDANYFMQLSHYGVFVGATIALSWAAGDWYSQKVVNTVNQMDQKMPETAAHVDDTGLSKMQWCALVAASFDRMADKAAPLTFVVKIGFGAMGRGYSLLTNALSGTIGLFSSRADIRTVKISMRKQNRLDQHHSAQANGDYDAVNDCESSIV